RAGQRQVLQHCPRRAGQPAARLVTAVKRQGHGTEQLREPLPPRFFPGHGNSPPPTPNIVNPPASPPASERPASATGAPSHPATDITAKDVTSAAVGVTGP